MKIWLVSGVSGSGKTTFCAALAQRARIQGRQVVGILSPGLFVDGVKTEIWSEDLGGGERRRLAARIRRGDEDLPFGEWFFNPQTLIWGNTVLGRAVGDLLVIDELGPLEFNFDMGWMAAFEVIASHPMQLALVVVRPELLGRAQELWPGAEIIYPAAFCVEIQERILASI